MRLTRFLPALLLAASAAHAAPDLIEDLGVNPCLRAETPSFFGASGSSFDLVYTFELRGKPQNLLAAAMAFDSRVPFQLRNAMLTLWRSNGDKDYTNDELIGGFDFFPNAVAQSFTALPAGRYFWRLEGIADGDGSVMFSAALNGSQRCER